MTDLSLPEAITRFKGNELRIDAFTNGNTEGYYTTVDGKKVETLPGLVGRLAAAIAAASAVRTALASKEGTTLVGHTTGLLSEYLDAQALMLESTRKRADTTATEIARLDSSVTGLRTATNSPYATLLKFN